LRILARFHLGILVFAIKRLTAKDAKGSQRA
jgi:hypothetical protein